MSSRYCTSVLWAQLPAQGWSDALLSFCQQGLSWVFRSCNSFFQTLLLPCKILDNIHLQNNDIRQYMLIIIMAKLSVSGNQSDTTLSWKACTPSVTSPAVKKTPLRWLSLLRPLEASLAQTSVPFVIWGFTETLLGTLLQLLLSPADRHSEGSACFARSSYQRDKQIWIAARVVWVRN